MIYINLKNEESLVIELVYNEFSKFKEEKELCLDITIKESLKDIIELTKEGRIQLIKNNGKFKKFFDDLIKMFPDSKVLVFLTSPQNLYRMRYAFPLQETEDIRIDLLSTPKVSPFLSGKLSMNHQ